MSIKELKNIADKAKYNEIAKETGNIFNTIDWLDMFGEKVKFFGIYEKDNKLTGGFTLYKENKFGLKGYRNPPFTPCIGPFLKIGAKNPVSTMSKWKEVVDLMAKAIERLPYSIVSISLNKNIIDTQPFIWKKFKVVPRYTYVLDLKMPIEDIQEGMSKERRNDITKAIKDRLTVKQNSNFEIVKSLVLKTFARQKGGINKFYLDKILFEFASKENCFAFLTLAEARPIAATFCIYDKNTAYYLLGGYDDKNKHHGAGALSIWGAIKYAKKLGLKYFDFEGSMIPKIEKYFRGFGGKLMPYYRINKARLPLEIVLKFFKREFF